MKFHIEVPGDPSVGIDSDHATIEMYAEFTGEDLVFAKEQLRQSFSELFDDSKVWVMTEEEYIKHTAEEKNDS